MNRQQLIAELKEMGIEVKDGKVKMSAIEAALSKPHCVTSMMDGQFWSIVKEIGWEKNPNIEATKQKLIKKYTPEQMEAFRTKSSYFQSKLQTWLHVIERDSDYRIPESDDGLSDILAHIVGLGKTHYDKVLKELSGRKTDTIDNYAEGKPKAVENFHYVIPREEDY